MKTEAVHITGPAQWEMISKELPEIGPREVLLKVAASGMCYSTYKAYSLGPEHKRVPDDVAENPVMTGHEFCGTIAQVGSELAGQYEVGQPVMIQPAMGLPTGYSPGYSYPYYGGDATYTIVPDFAIDMGCILPYGSDYMANASLAEPMMCIIGAFHSNFHTTQFVYEHRMGIEPGGDLALLGCGGPMGLGAIQYALNGPYKPRTIVVTDIDADRLARAEQLLPPSLLEGTGRRLVYINTAECEDIEATLRAETPDDKGFDDVFVFAVNRELVETAQAIMGFDGCLNFFAGPTDKNFSAMFNFYDVHYEIHHVVGTSGGSRSDMEEALKMAAEGTLNPSMMISHVGGLDAVGPTLEHFPQIGGGKKMFYPHVKMPLTAIADFRKLSAGDARFGALADICEGNDNIWSAEAEKYLLENWK